MRKEAVRSSNVAGEVFGIGTGPFAGRGWQWLPGLCLKLAALYVVLPYGRLTGFIYLAATVLAATGITAAAGLRQQLFRPTAWILVAAALAAIGHGIWYWLDLRGLEAFPSSAEIFYLAVYPLFIGALCVLGRRSDRDDGALIHCADQALYDAKDAGRNRLVCT